MTYKILQNQLVIKEVILKNAIPLSSSITDKCSYPRKLKDESYLCMCVHWLSILVSVVSNEKLCSYHYSKPLRERETR